ATSTSGRCGHFQRRLRSAMPGPSPTASAWAGGAAAPIARGDAGTRTGVCLAGYRVCISCRDSKWIFRVCIGLMARLSKSGGTSIMDAVKIKRVALCGHPVGGEVIVTDAPSLTSPAASLPFSLVEVLPLERLRFREGPFRIL